MSIFEGYKLQFDEEEVSLILKESLTRLKYYQDLVHKLDEIEELSEQEKYSKKIPVILTTKFEKIDEVLKFTNKIILIKNSDKPEYRIIKDKGKIYSLYISQDNEDYKIIENLKNISKVLYDVQRDEEKTLYEKFESDVLAEYLGIIGAEYFIKEFGNIGLSEDFNYKKYIQEISIYDEELKIGKKIKKYLKKRSKDSIFRTIFGQKNNGELEDIYKDIVKLFALQLYEPGDWKYFPVLIGFVDAQKIDKREKYLEKTKTAISLINSRNKYILPGNMKINYRNLENYVKEFYKILLKRYNELRW